MKRSLNNSLSLKRSKQDAKYFYEWLGYTWGKHIGEWMNLYLNRGDVHVHRVCIIAPRDHSKSTTLRVAVLWSSLFEQWRDKPFTTWLFSASKDLASRRLEEIRDDMKRHPQLRNLIDPKRGGKYEIRFTNGAWIRATGVGAAIRGEHPARIVFDDVLDDMGDQSPDTLRHWFRKKITPMLSPGTSTFVVGTPMSMTDLYHTEMLSNEAWKSVITSAIPNWEEHKADPTVEPIALWAEQRPISFLMEQRKAIGELAFTQEYLCKVVDDEAQAFKREHTRANMDVNAVIEWENDGESKYVIGFDPSQGLGKDYSVLVVLKQDSEGFVHFVNMWRRNDFPPDRQADMIGEWTRKFNCMVAAEDVGFQRLFESLLIQKGITVDYQPSKVSNRALKQALMNRVRVWFEQKKICFPYGNDETRRMVNLLLDELDTHVWKGGHIVDVGKHNDTTMAFAHPLDQMTGDLTKVSIPMETKVAKGSSWGGNSSSNTRRFITFGG